MRLTYTLAACLFVSALSAFGQGEATQQTAPMSPDPSDATQVKAAAAAATTAAQQAKSAADDAAKTSKNAESATEKANAAAADAAKAGENAKSATDRANAAAASAQALINQAMAASQQAVKDKSAADKAKAAASPAVAVQGNDNVGPKDYVPCLFDRATLLAMRGYGNSNYLSDSQANAAVSAALSKVPTEDKENVSKSVTAGLQAIKQQKFALTVSDVNVTLSQGLTATNPTAKQQALDAAAAASNAAQFTRSTAIACSMSIFPWDISHMVFGRTVANHYLAVQIIVRNLDQDHEYLIHDSELAVDAYSGQLERFQASHEKEAVRGVVVYGQNYDLHAVWSHTVEGIGMIAGAIVGFPQPSIDQLTQASGAYNAAWIPTFQKLFPDLTTNNLNNLNDLGFSAASASRIVVPKAGAVPFVIFVPIHPLEQACWLQYGYTPKNDVIPNNACDAIDPSNSKWATNPRQVSFKDWKPTQLTALQKHTYAVIAGSLIQQLSDSASLRGITCGNPGSDGKVYLASIVGPKATAGKPLNCSLSGSALDSMIKLRLEDGTGATIADAAVTPGADGTTAQAVIASSDVPKLTSGSYELFSVDKTGNATDLKQALGVVPPPVVTGAPTATPTSPAGAVATLSAKSLQPGFALALAGTGLDQITQVKLVSGGTTLAGASPNASPANTVSVFPATPGLTSGQTYEVIVGVGPSKVAYDLGQTLGPLQ